MRRLALILCVIFLSGCTAVFPETESSGVMTLLNAEPDTLPQTISKDEIGLLLAEILKSEQGSADTHPAKNATHLLQFMLNDGRNATIYFNTEQRSAVIEYRKDGHVSFESYKDVGVDLSQYDWVTLAYEPGKRPNQLALKALVTPQLLARVGNNVPYDIVPAVGFTYRLEMNCDAYAVPAFVDSVDSVDLEDVKARDANSTVWLITSPYRICDVETVDSMLRITVSTDDKISTIQVSDVLLTDIEVAAFVSQENMEVLHVIKTR